MIYFAGVGIGVVIFCIRMFIGDEFWLQALENSIPVVTVLLVKKLINIFITKRMFLNRKSKILSVNNFRAFNVYLYFWFFYDCFLGFLSSIIRILKATGSAIFMMPSQFYIFELKIFN